MSDDIWVRDEIDSPCQKICVMHPGAEICIGCHRTRDEITVWSSLSAVERGKIMAALPARASQLRGKRRGGKARG